MKMSKNTRDILASITDEDIIAAWGEDTYEDDLSKWSNEKFLESLSWIKKKMPWKAIDCAIEVWEKYLSVHEKCTATDGLGGLSTLRRAAWSWSTTHFDEFFSYHYDLAICVAYIDNGVLDYQYSQPNTEQISKAVEALKAIRQGHPSPFSQEEKEQIKSKFRGYCNEQGQQKAYQKYFGQSSEEVKRFQ